MGKSKSNPKPSKHQTCHFLIGPVSSWFMPNTTDIWSQPGRGNDTCLSYFAYGSIGCFCFGEIHHRVGTNQKSGVVTRLVEIKDDNSRAACVRFLKESLYPTLIVLTESGSLVIHDCIRNESLIKYKKYEILANYAGLVSEEGVFSGEQSAKKAKVGVTQQINSCSWPNAKNIFLGISLIKEKDYFLLWLKIKDVNTIRLDEQPVNRDTLVESSQKIEVGLQQYANSICLVESIMLNETTCIIAVAMDDGHITVISFDLDKGQIKRTVKLDRHNDQICSISMNVGNQKRFPLGLLASVSRDGLMLVWDIENEFYFADYQAVIDIGSNRSQSARINWFALSFVCLEGLKHPCLAISSTDSGLTLLEIPENARSKIRLKESQKDAGKKGNKQQQASMSTLKHNALIFNVEYDATTNTLITSSLDGNHILWTAEKSQGIDSSSVVELRPQYLVPAMSNSSRTHMIRSSPIRDDLVCLALGKAGVKFYKISDNLMDCRFDMSSSCSLVARKISKANVSPTSISWHPNHEYRLAIGTLEGKVYRVDITPRKAQLVEADYKLVTNQTRAEKVGSINANQAFDVEFNPVDRPDPSDNKPKQNGPKTDGIYSLCWGPSPANPNDVSKFAIYAVGSISHQLFIYYSTKDTSDKLTNYLDEFNDESLPESLNQASEVAWKTSMDLMALGTQGGQILIIAYLDEAHEGRSNGRLFKKIATIEGPFGSSFIQCLAWHPTMDREDQHYYYLAASSNESPAFVFNLKESLLVANVKEQLNLEQADQLHQNMEGADTLMTDKSDLTRRVTVLSMHLNKLDGHKKAITDIAWSPHEPNQIATSSFDRMCYVWSIETPLLDSKMLAKFCARDRLFTLEWSLVDPDLIMTSGHDSTIWAWRPSENHAGSIE